MSFSRFQRWPEELPPMSEFIPYIKISHETDIVDRLRDIAGWLRLGRSNDEIGTMCLEAANEIERLRRSIDGRQCDQVTGSIACTTSPLGGS